MEIYTDRLLLRPFRAQDGEQLYAYLSDPQTVYFEPYLPYTREAALEEAANRAQNPAFIAVCLRETGALIGNLYLSQGEFAAWELGYVFNAAYRKRGYATEAAAAAMDAAFSQLGARRLVANCALLNEPSWRLMERLGMRREGLSRKAVWFKKDAAGEPIWWDSLHYALLREEWQEMRQNQVTPCPEGAGVV